MMSARLVTYVMMTSQRRLVFNSFNSLLAIEAGYDYLGKFTGAGLADDSVDAFTLAPKLTFGISDAVNVYGKLGGAYVNYGDKSDESCLGALGLEFEYQQ
ncbi:hypothetical protein VIAQ111709_07265 [Vibrio aquimaris]|uniref:Outer membrane protein A n=2 Tax=Vibrio aquimaris TaxID=2587862 RepID=A0A5P9CJB9_9VIBR|nr:outer membrane protein A [Vibrio aquimaris]